MSCQTNERATLTAIRDAITNNRNFMELYNSWASGKDEGGVSEYRKGFMRTAAKCGNIEALRILASFPGSKYSLSDLCFETKNLEAIKFLFGKVKEDSNYFDGALCAFLTASSFAFWRCQ